MEKIILIGHGSPKKDANNVEIIAGLLHNTIHTGCSDQCVKVAYMQFVDPNITAAIDECIAEVAAFWGPCFVKRNIRFQVKCVEALPSFEFDSHKTQRVLSNLLENAMRFTPAYGSVTLATELCQWNRRTRRLPIAIERRAVEIEEPNAVRISVTDDGPGIAAEHHQDIFNAYVRLVQPGQKSAGTGLGLAIARNLVTALRGKIWVESEPNCGCKFSFLLPLKRN